MFGLTFCFQFSRNKNTKNVFLKENVFLDLLKITFFVNVFYFIQNEILILIENEILLFLVFGSFGKIFSLFKKIFSLKIFSKIQPNAFSSPFSISSKNEKKKTIKSNTPYIILVQNLFIH